MNQAFLFDADPEPIASVPGYPCAFSPDRVYRYCLWRLWRNIAAPRYILWIMLNPSTADEDDLDPTLRRCIDFSKQWDFDGMCIANLFAFRATLPEDMKATDDPVGDENDAWLAKLAGEAGIVIAAWGNDGAYQRRAEAVRVLLASMGAKLHYLKLNADGSPMHPLYAKGSLVPKPWKFERDLSAMEESE